MRKNYGLRTEIIVSLLVLMGAALLFSGMLLLKLAEVELVRQQEGALLKQVSLAARLIVTNGPSPNEQIRELNNILDELRAESWFLTDTTLKVIASSTLLGRKPDLDAIASSKNLRDAQVHTYFSSSWFFRPERTDNHVIVTAPLISGGDYLGTIQVRFSLSQVDEQLAGAWRISLFYVGLYGIVLFFFGLWLLNKNIIRPIQALMTATERIAIGDLEQQLPTVDGPQEITTLALSFNAMIASLKESRQQTEEHIISLEQANTKVLRTQTELIRSEKLASVGRLAAGMAHEIGNPLGAVIGYLGLLKSDLTDKKQLEIASFALQESERIDRLVREMLDYAAPARGQSEIFDPVTAVNEAQRLLYSQGLFDGLIVENLLPGALPRIYMLRHQLIQVFVNLLINARDASVPGGTIRMRGGKNEDSIWISIIDDGEGMTSEIQEQIFEPFFTTKPTSRGRGLGLAVCQRIISETDGKMELRSSPGCGSTFTIWLKISGEHE